MDKQEIITRLTPVARKVFENENLVLCDDQSAENLDNWTSLSFMHFLTEIEKEFGIKFRMMELFSLKNMGDIINAISRH